MAQTTTNYGLYKPEATDTYNHLVYDNPNMDTIDATMKDNADHAIDNASCIKSGTVHSVTRSNTSCPVFKFTATGDWNTGDTMNVDGTPVSVFLPDGTAPLTGCFVINTEVLAAISGSRVTLYCPIIPDANNVPYDNTTSGLTATDVQDAIDEVKAITDAAMVQVGVTLSYFNGTSLRGSVSVPAGYTLNKCVITPCEYTGISIKVSQFLKITSPATIMAFGNNFTSGETLDVIVLFFK